MRRPSGQSLLEILIAQTIFLVGISVAILLIIHILNTTTRTTKNTQAIAYAKEAISALQNMRDQGFSNLPAGTYGLEFQTDKFVLVPAPDTLEDLMRTVTITDIDNRTKKVTAEVSFPLQVGTHTLTLDAIMTNFRVLPEAYGDWANPRVVGSVDLGPESKGRDVYVVDNHLYIVAENSSKNRPHIFIFDVTDPTSPALLGDAVGNDDLFSVVAKGGHIFTAGKENSKEFQEFTDSGGVPSPLLQINLTGDQDGIAIALSGNTVGLGRKSRDNNFVLFDISSPASPRVAGSVTVNGDVNAIVFSGSYAYLATSGGNELVIVDVTNIDAPVVAGQIDAPGSAEALSLYISQGELYLGKHENGGLGEFFIYDLAEPASPSLLGTLDIDDDINDLAVSLPYAFLATDDSNRELQIFNVTNPASITSVGNLNLSNIATAVFLKKNRLYFSVKSNDGLQIVGPGP